MGKLTALQVKSAKPKDKQDKLTDGEGLYLLVMPNGSKYWRYDYRYQGKRKTLPLGVYPDVSLSDARDLHAEARRKVKNGIDPTHERKVAKLTKGMAKALAAHELVVNDPTYLDVRRKSEFLDRVDGRIQPKTKHYPLSDEVLW